MSDEAPNAQQQHLERASSGCTGARVHSRQNAYTRSATRLQRLMQDAQLSTFLSGRDALTLQPLASTSGFPFALPLPPVLLFLTVEF